MIMKSQFKPLAAHQFSIKRKTSKGTNKTFTNKSSIPSKSDFILYVYLRNKNIKSVDDFKHFWENKADKPYYFIDFDALVLSFGTSLSL